MAKRSIALTAISLLVLLPIALSPAFATDKEVVVTLGSLREAHIAVNRGDHVTWEECLRGEGAPGLCTGLRRAPGLDRRDRKR